MDKHVLRKRNVNLAGFTGFKDEDTTVTVMESLTSLNPKYAFKHRTENLFYVSFETEAALFNACDKTIYINDRHIKGFPKGANWEQRDRFLSKYCTKRQEIAHSKGYVKYENTLRPTEKNSSAPGLAQSTWTLKELKNRDDLTSAKDDRIIEFLEHADYTIYPKLPSLLPDYSSQMLDLFEPDNVIDEIINPTRMSKLYADNRSLIIIEDIPPDLPTHKALPSFTVECNSGPATLSSAAVIYRIESNISNIVIFKN
jgi:hypothetical protein